MKTPSNDGGAAFPNEQWLWDNRKGSYVVRSVGGMTLRDYFAGQALAGLCVRAEDDGRITEWRFHDIANVALKAADAMLAARERKEDAP